MGTLKQPSWNDSKSRASFAVLLTVVSLLTGAAPLWSAGQEPTPIEQITQKPRFGKNGLGTASYRPSDREKPLFEKLAETERTTGGLVGEYSLAGKEGRNVGWFGIVRDISEDKTADRTTLLVEHKYFDGLTDAHIQAVSFNGGGDFRAVLHGVDCGIRPLTLVKIYGNVAKVDAGELPLLEAAFIRQWHWGTFTFLAAHGKQSGSDKWRKLNRVELDDIYEPYPNDAYYEQRLGKRPDNATRQQTLRRLALGAAKALGLPDALPFRTDDDQKQAASYVDDAHFRGQATLAAEKVRPKSAAIIQPVIDAILKDGASELAEAIQATVKEDVADAVYTVLAEALRLKHEDTRIAVSEALAQNGYGARMAVAPLAAALNDSNEHVRNLAAKALGNIGAEAKQAVPALIAALDDQDHYVRANACEAIGQIHLLSDFAVPSLVAALQDGDNHVRFQAAGALQAFGAEASAAAAPLREALLRDADGAVRWSAARSLAAVDPQGTIALPALSEAIQSKNPHVRRFAAMGLGLLGLKAKDAAPLLAAGLKDPDPGARIAAAEALWRVDGNAADTVPVLMKLVDPDQGIVSYWAAGAISNIGPKSKDALPALRKMLSTSRWPDEAVKAIGNMGPDAKDAVPDLVKLLDHDDSDMRGSAAGALWKISRDPRAVPAVLAELKRSEGRSLAAVIAAGEIGPEIKEAKPLVQTALKNPAIYVRVSRN